MSSLPDIPDIVGLRIEAEVDLTSQNTFGITAIARALAEADDEPALEALLAWRREAAAARENGSAWPLFVLGGGSNIIFSKDYYDALFLCLSGRFAQIERLEEGLVRVGAAATSGELLGRCDQWGLGGLACLWGVPGTVGGAVVGNAGCGGQSISSQVAGLRVMDEHGRTSSLKPEEARFGYRSSALDDRLVLSADLRVEPLAEHERRLLKEEALAARRGQPRGVGSAGCVFRNPPGDAAGRLIEAAGLKEARIGAAQISAEHANYIINTGGATGWQVLALIDRARRAVKDKFNLWLELEVRIL